MKRTLLLFSLLFAVCTLYGQVTINQVDDFEDGTTANWTEPSATAPVNVATDGPDGVDDSYLRDTTTGVAGGSGARMVIRNLGNQWSGNFTSEGVQAISFDARALINTINVRVSITGPGGKFSSTNSVAVATEDGWVEVGIPMAPGDWTAVSDGLDGGSAGTDINATLANVTEFRIISAPSPMWRGEIIDAEMHLDNITALATLSTLEVDRQNSELTISPNPAKDKLNITLPSGSGDMNLEVFDVLGKRVYNGVLTQLESSVNVSRWKSGVYLVRVSNNSFTQTKRFIKQ